MAQTEYAEKINGQIMHISDVALVPPGQRPWLFCFVCGDRLVPKCGDEREHHFAHQSNVNCALSCPETALHFNAKMRMARLLNEDDMVRVDTQCPQCGKPGKKAHFHYDTVEVERAVGSKRPDITLLSEGFPRLAIEIYASHKVDNTKAQWFKDNRLSWLEFEANDVLAGKSNARAGRIMESRLCKSCMNNCLDEPLPQGVPEARSVLAWAWVQLMSGVLCYTLHLYWVWAPQYELAIVRHFWRRLPGRRYLQECNVIKILHSERLTTAYMHGRTFYDAVQACGLYVNRKIVRLNHYTPILNWTSPDKDISIDNLTQTALGFLW